MASDDEESEVEAEADHVSCARDSKGDGGRAFMSNSAGSSRGDVRFQFSNGSEPRVLVVAVEMSSG